jgi:hypothetical protein
MAATLNERKEPEGGVRRGEELMRKGARREKERVRAEKAQRQGTRETKKRLTESIPPRPAGNSTSTQRGERSLHAGSVSQSLEKDASGVAGLKVNQGGERGERGREREKKKKSV